jgi:YHS domain-containing protein
MRNYRFVPAIAIAMVMAFTGAALAVTGEFGGMCTQGLAQHQKVQTDCSINATYDGKTYCFGNQEAELTFFKDPAGNLAKAEAYYKEINK